MIGFVNRYVYLAGRSCCAGRSWVGLDRSLARRAAEDQAGSCEARSSVVSDSPEGPAISSPVDTQAERVPG
jgi:hypothetical protein